MRNQLNDNLIAAVKQHFPPGENLITSLMELFSLGREAIYRRFRNEVPFTFGEVAKISQKFGISLDQVISMSDNSDHSQWAYLDINDFYTSQHYLDQYFGRMEMFSSVLQDMQRLGKGTIRCAYSIIPYTFYISFEKLSKFRHYKWNYLTKGVNPNFLLSEMLVSSRILDLEKKFLNDVRSAPRTLLILDQNIFSSTLNDIKYFYDRGLISERELYELKEELYELLSYIEQLAATGTYGNGTEVIIFLSEIGLDSSYVHIESGDKDFCINWTHFVDISVFENPKMSQRQKEWIELLKRYSTLITQTGEVHRFAFLNKQRQLIDMLI